MPRLPWTRTPDPKRDRSPKPARVKTEGARGRGQGQVGGCGLASDLFAEFFAGGGELTRAVRTQGVPTMPPDDLATGGVDFDDVDQVAALRKELRAAAASQHLVVHLAPQCATFSRARDRAARTRLR